jgi:hypothetical protein
VGDLEAAVSFLDQKAESKTIVDRMAVLETRGTISVIIFYHLLRLVQLDCSPK